MFRTIVVVGAVVVTGILFLTACIQSELKPPTLVVGIEAGYAPYAFRDVDGQIVGLDLDVAEALAQQLGRRLVVKEMAWDALVIALKQEKIDLWMSGVSITPERQEEIAMVPYLSEPEDTFALLFWNAIPDDVTAIADLEGRGQIAVQMGTPLQMWLEKQSGLATKSVEAISDMMMELKYGKIIAGLVDPIPARAAQAQLPNLQVMMVPLAPGEAGNQMGIGIRQNNQELVKQIQEALNHLRTEGALDQIEARWEVHR